MIVDIKGVAPAQFPDGMDKNSIREFLRQKYSQQAINGKSDILQPVENIAAPYEKSLVEKIGTGISDTLTDTGIISNRYGANQIGENIATLGEFLPGIGDATAGDEFGRALEKGNYGQAALSGIGLVPGVGEIGQAIFGGILAKNADLGALRAAKMLEDTGADRNKIWKETGWVNDKGDWKFEISDSLDFDTGKGANINPSSFNIIKEYGGTTQANVVGHPELYEAYPNLSDRPVRSALGNGAQYNTKTDTISMGESILNPNSGAALDKAQSINLHEVQHAIQNREGFASGGSPNQFTKLSKGEIDEFTQMWGDVDFLKKHGADRYEFLYGKKPSKDDLYLAKNTSHDQIRKNINELTAQESPRWQHNQYERLAGEAEARNVQTRLDWTPEQRRATPPWESLDVPEDELIYRK